MSFAFDQAVKNAESKIMSAAYDSQTKGEVAIASAVLAHALAMQEIAEALRHGH